MSDTNPQDAQEFPQSAIRDGPTVLGNALNDPYAWRLPQDVISLENFDYPNLHRRSEFDANKIGGIIAPRMAGCLIQAFAGNKSGT